MTAPTPTPDAAAVARDTKRWPRDVYGTCGNPGCPICRAALARAGYDVDSDWMAGRRARRAYERQRQDGASAEVAP